MGERDKQNKYAYDKATANKRGEKKIPQHKEKHQRGYASVLNKMFKMTYVDMNTSTKSDIY